MRGGDRYSARPATASRRILPSGSFQLQWNRIGGRLARSNRRANDRALFGELVQRRPPRSPVGCLLVGVGCTVDRGLVKGAPDDLHRQRQPTLCKADGED
jgi:hypothetical protein